MKLAIFGPTGTTGKLLVQQALDAGHSVVAFARNPDKLDLQHPQLSVVAGQISDPMALARAIAGVDAVLSTLGPTDGGSSKGRPVTQGVENILAAMRTHGVRRCVFVSTPSAVDPNDTFNLKFALMVTLVKYGVRDAYDDIVHSAQAVRTSDTDWTLLRVPMLTRGKKTGRIRAGFIGKDPIGAALSRANLVDFMLHQLESPAYVRKAPAVSNG